MSSELHDFPAFRRRWRKNGLRFLLLAGACALLAAAFLPSAGKRDDVRVRFLRRRIDEQGVHFIRLLATNAGARPVLLSSLNVEVRIHGLWLALCRDYTIGRMLPPGESTTFTVPALNQGEAFRGTVATGCGYGRWQMLWQRAQAKIRSLFGKPVGVLQPFPRWQTNTVPEFSVRAP